MISELRIGYLARLKGIAKDVRRTLDHVAQARFQITPKYLDPPMDDPKAMLPYYFAMVTEIYQAQTGTRHLVISPFPAPNNIRRDAPLAHLFGVPELAEVLAKFREDVRCPPGQTKACDVVYRVPIVVPVPGPVDLAGEVQKLRDNGVTNALVVHSANLTGHNDHLSSDKRVDLHLIQEMLFRLIKGDFAALPVMDVFEVAQ